MKLKNLFLAAGLTLLGSATMSATDFYVIGANVNGASWTLSDPGAVMQLTDEGTYEWYGDVLGTGFKINDGTWDHPEFNFGAANGEALTIGQPLKYVLNSGSDITFADGIMKVLKPRVVLNPISETITVYGEVEANPAEENYYLIGSLTGWTFNDQYILTKESDGGYSYTLNLSEGDEFKFTYGAGWGINFGADKSREIGISDEETLTTRSNGDNFLCTKEGRYTLTLYPSSNLLTCKLINTEQPPVTPTDYAYPAIQKDNYSALHHKNTSWVANILMPDAAFDNLASQQIPVCDLTPNKGSMLYIWDNTFSTGETYYDNGYSGMNAEPFIVGNNGWSGAGFNIEGNFYELSKITDDTHLHISYCAYENNAPESIGFILANELKFAVGEPFNDNGTIFPSVGLKATDGWITIDFTIGELKSICHVDKEITFVQPENMNILSFLGGGVSGTGFVLGNVFFYNREENIPEETLYVIGANVNGKSWELASANARMKMSADGTCYTWEGEVLGTGFKINDGTWDNPEFNFGSPYDGSRLTLGEPFNYELNGDNINFAGDVMKIFNPRVVLNLSENTITVTGNVEENPAKENYYLIGTFTNWEFSDEFIMTEIAEGSNQYSYEIDVTAGDEFKFSYGPSWAVNYGADELNIIGDTESEGDNVFVVKIKKDGSNFKCAESGKCTFILIPENNQLAWSFKRTQEPPVIEVNPELSYESNAALHTNNISWVANLVMPSEELDLLKEKNVPVTEIGPNFETNHLYIWEGLEPANYFGGEYGESGVVPLIVNAINGWSGAGFYLGERNMDLSNITDKTHLHLSYLAYDNNAPESIGFMLNDGTLKFSLGEPFKDNGTLFTSIGSKGSSEWKTIDITIGELKALNNYTGNIAFENIADGNILSFFAGAVSGTGFVLANIYFYNTGENTPVEPTLGLYVIGENVNGKQWELAQPDACMEMISDGVYRWSGQILGKEFKINNGTWNDPDYNIGYRPVEYVYEQTVNLREAFEYYAGMDARNIVLPFDFITNPTIILDTRTHTITVDGNVELNSYVTITLEPAMSTRLIQKVGDKLNVSFGLDEYWRLSKLTVNGVDRFEDYGDNIIVDLNLETMDIVAKAEFDGKLEVIDINSGVAELENNVTIRVADGKIYLNGLTRGETVTLYTVSGIVMKKLTAESETMTIDAEAGLTLVVRVGNAAAKVIL